MDFFNVNKKKLDVKSNNSEIKNYEKQDTFTKFSEVIDGTGKTFGLLGCKTCEAVAEVAKTGIDNQKEKIYNEYKEAKSGGIEESVKTMRNLTDTDIEMFEKGITTRRRKRKKIERATNGQKFNITNIITN
ncbi:hypothetical protein [Campylobacter concisus]